MSKNILEMERRDKGFYKINEDETMDFFCRKKRKKKTAISYFTCFSKFAVFSQSFLSSLSFMKQRMVSLPVKAPFLAVKSG